MSCLWVLESEVPTQYVYRRHRAVKLEVATIYARHHTDTIRVLDIRFPRYAGTQEAFPDTFHLLRYLVFTTVRIDAAIRNGFHLKGPTPGSVSSSADDEACPDTGCCSDTRFFSGTGFCSDTGL